MIARIYIVRSIRNKTLLDKKQDKAFSLLHFYFSAYFTSVI